jgi:hypothetical protein
VAERPRRTDCFGMRHARTHRFLCLSLVACTALTGCTDFVYQPAASPRMAIRADGKVVRCGKVVKSLHDAVSGDPAAESELQRGDHHETVAVALGWTSAGGMFGGLVGSYVIAMGRTSLPGVIATVATTVVSVGLLIGSQVASMRSNRHRVNAMNMRNDGELQPCPADVAPPPPEGAVGQQGAGKIGEGLHP